jgi:Family of unknown function (DUF6161)
MPNEIIEVSLGKNSGTKVFNSLDELKTWLAKEQQIWSWLNQPPHTNEKQNVFSQFNQFYNSLNQQISQVNNVKLEATQRKQEPDFTPYFNRIKSSFQNFYENQRGILSETATGKFIEQLKSQCGDGVATFACGYFMGIQLAFGSRDGVCGVIASYCFENGWKDSAASEKQALDELRVNWQGIFQKFEKELKAESEKHIKLNSDGEALLKKQQSDGETLLKKQDTLFAELVTTTKNEWQNLKTTYDAELAIRAPVLYWKKKTTSHLILSWVFAGLAIIVGGVIFYSIFREVKTLLTPPVGVANPEQWHPEYWRLALLTASGLFGVWIVRIVVRLFLSNVHLHTDAKERVTMVQTYLALLRRGKITKDDERLILQTLFRPTSTGIMKDDGVPLTALEAISKLNK